jgi:hemerythrin-like metal-binding protein
MAFVDWRASFSVSSAELDAHHQRLFEILNDLHEQILARRGRVALGESIEALLSYTQYHFAAEEQVMVTCGFPGYAAHKQEHEKLLTRVQEMDQAFQDPQGNRHEAVPEALAFLLKDWLLDHILVMDKAFAPFVARHNASLSPQPGQPGGEDWCALDIPE